MIKVDNLSYSFPQKDLYNNISFTLEDGTTLCFYRNKWQWKKYTDRYNYGSRKIYVRWKVRDRPKL